MGKAIVKNLIFYQSENVLHIDVRGSQFSSGRYEELLSILICHKLAFESYLLNIVQKVNQNLHALAGIST